MEACTLDLYQKNIFRITGLPVDATPKEVATQAKKLQMMIAEGLEGNVGGAKAAFPLAPPPTTEQIREALARMKEPEHRLIDEFFWYWPENFGSSKSDPAIQAVLAGDGQRAVHIWGERESDGRSLVAAHNLAVMFHMYAVDWTNHHILYNIDKDRDEKIKGYWRDAFDRWETLADADEIWDVMKERVRSLEDEALTTGFVRRMRRLLPQGFDRVNAEAALKFADLGRLDWTKYHVDFMRQTNQGMDDVDSTAELVLEPTRKRVEQRLRAADEQADERPAEGIKVAKDLMSHCKPLLAVFDLFHGDESHHRSELFDEVAETVANVLHAYQKSTGDTRAFVDLMKQALLFASGSHIRERLINYIAAGEDNLAAQKLAPIFKSLNSIEESHITPASKLQRIQREIMGQLPTLASSIGPQTDIYNNLVDSVAIVLRSVSVEAHNSASDLATALAAIELAYRLAADPALKKRIADDRTTLMQLANKQKQWNKIIKIRSDEFEINENFVRYNNTTIRAEEITGVRFGVFIQVVNGVRSSSYQIGVQGKGDTVSLECKRMLRSEAQAEADFKEILEALLNQIVQNFVLKLAEIITSGKQSVSIGPLTLTSAGVNCEVGSLWWKKMVSISYKHISCSSRQGTVFVSATVPEKVSFTLDRRQIWNAVILENLIEVIQSIQSGQR
jgi:hypothetical protein